jgi:hypothetical protein
MELNILTICYLLLGYFHSWIKMLSKPATGKRKFNCRIRDVDSHSELFYIAMMRRQVANYG